MGNTIQIIMVSIYRLQFKVDFCLLKNVYNRSIQYIHLQNNIIKINAGIFFLVIQETGKTCLNLFDSTMLSEPTTETLKVQISITERDFVQLRSPNINNRTSQKELASVVI